MAADVHMQQILERDYVRGFVRKTGKDYTFDSRRWNDYDNGINPVTYDEYEYQGKKYIRIKANTCYDEAIKLSNGMEVKSGDYVWVEVQPVIFRIDRKTGMLISKKGLVSGIRYHEKKTEYKGDFKKTEMYTYLNTHMVKDIFQSAQLVNTQNLTPEEKTKLEQEQQEEAKKRNPYQFDFGELSEEDIIRGGIESGIAVFLHGPSSEGKSARVKQIDPDCEIIYLLTITPESLVGKSVYNQATGEMIDVPPAWLRKVQEKCEKEPDKLHVIFFDELTNALPSIQGMAFNIILDREVNGIWKLPDNARIVAAGNEMKDSIVANQLAEPLFNRFAHVYIKTTLEGWLKWASESHIHPAIYTYMVYTNGEALRSEYTGEKPNADPRKWEMASKMLYTTGRPEMLRSLVGEDITKSFIQFCSQRVIMLEDVIHGNYKEEEIESLNTAERYATVMGLTRVTEENLSIVRAFTNKIGPEFTAIFDTLWTRGDESRLERILEEKLASEGGINR